MIRRLKYIAALLLIPLSGRAVELYDILMDEVLPWFQRPICARRRPFRPLGSGPCHAGIQFASLAV
jgi:hypothetical protein